MHGDGDGGRRQAGDVVTKKEREDHGKETSKEKTRRGLMMFRKGFIPLLRDFADREVGAAIALWVSLMNYNSDSHCQHGPVKTRAARLSL